MILNSWLHFPPPPPTHSKAMFFMNSPHEKFFLFLSFFRHAAFVMMLHFSVFSFMHLSFLKDWDETFSFFFMRMLNKWTKRRCREAWGMMLKFECTEGVCVRLMGSKGCDATFKGMKMTRAVKAFVWDYEAFFFLKFRDFSCWELERRFDVMKLGVDFDGKLLTPRVKINKSWVFLKILRDCWLKNINFRHEALKFQWNVEGKFRFSILILLLALKAQKFCF